ncbi:MAG: sigma-70 family RNA polymerase sigma factor [bacterium]|nr:sigma-70 family RNA polymerase sigma factor [bacterium]
MEGREDSVDENVIISYIEPIYRFCCKRLNSRADAEDLASEILCHILAGMKKYKIESFDAWVWRVAHNRYARWIDRQRRERAIPTETESLFQTVDAAADEAYDRVDEEALEKEFDAVYRFLHTLSAAYRNIFIDYYVGEMSVRALSEKYGLPETTVKWRLHVGRKKIRERIGETHMGRVYKRINWNTTGCNGNMDADQYLHTQIARAVCGSIYEKPLTVEEISVSTGIPAMYIEDELPRLAYGDAVCRIGNRYAANFIILRLQDREAIGHAPDVLVEMIADEMERLLQSRADEVKALDFYGHDFGMDRLGYILIPYLLRQKIRRLKGERLGLKDGAYPMRRDGGYGWFIVEETVDESEICREYSAGCNRAGNLYYYWIEKYFDRSVCRGRGICWLDETGILQNADAGVPDKKILSDEDAARLIQNHLLVRAGDQYRFRFACFTREQFEAFLSLFDEDDEQLDDSLTEWIKTVRERFAKVVPARLEDQINQWVSEYLSEIVGTVIEELIRRGSLRKADPDKPLTDGVFYVDGGEIDP